MKKRNLLIVVCMAILTLMLSSVNAGNKTDRHRHDLSYTACRAHIHELPAGQDPKDTYTCPMHPAVVSEKAGKCPSCGMNLVKKEETKTTYTCPMHKEVVSDKAGKCPKCGMNLEKKEAEKCAYVCPMHKDCTCDKACKCPKCGMNMVEKEDSKKTEPKK